MEDTIVGAVVVGVATDGMEHLFVLEFGDVVVGVVEVVDALPTTEQKKPKGTNTGSNDWAFQQWPGDCWDSGEGVPNLLEAFSDS